MPTGPTITIDLDAGRRAELDALAAATSRDTVALVTDAIDAYLHVERWRHAHILEGIRQADAGEFATDKDVDEVFDRRR